MSYEPRTQGTCKRVQNMLARARQAEEDEEKAKQEEDGAADHKSKVAYTGVVEQARRFPTLPLPFTSLLPLVVAIAP